MSNVCSASIVPDKELFFCNSEKEKKRREYELQISTNILSFMFCCVWNQQLWTHREIVYNWINTICTCIIKWIKRQVFLNKQRTVVIWSEHILLYILYTVDLKFCGKATHTKEANIHLWTAKNYNCLHKIVLVLKNRIEYGFGNRIKTE